MRKNIRLSLFSVLCISLAVVVLSGCAAYQAEENESAPPVAAAALAPVVATSDTKDQRITLNKENIAKYNPDNSTCLKFSQSKPTTTKPYKNAEKGIATLDLPYNPDWGDKTYRIDAYDVMQDGSIQFGSIVSGIEGCGWIRLSSLGFLPQQSAADVIKKINADSVRDRGEGSIPPYKAKQYLINGITAVQYENDGMCAGVGIILIGEKYNYKLDQNCGDDADFVALETVAKSIRFALTAEQLEETRDGPQDPEDAEPLSYSTDGVSVRFSKTISPFDFTAEELKSWSDRWGPKRDISYFNTLVEKFKGTTKTAYNFKYTGPTPFFQPDTFVVTLLPNKMGYTSLKQFENDFPMYPPEGAGDYSPTMLNKGWLLFVNGCVHGQNADTLQSGCKKVQDIIQSTFKLN